MMVGCAVFLSTVYVTAKPNAAQNNGQKSRKGAETLRLLPLFLNAAEDSPRDTVTTLISTWEVQRGTSSFPSEAGS